jgi:hypothetical protein
MDKLVNLIIEGLLTFVPGKWSSITRDQFILSRAGMGCEIIAA